jgi:hypothetical protein
MMSWCGGKCSTNFGCSYSLLQGKSIKIIHRKVFSCCLGRKKLGNRLCKLLKPFSKQFWPTIRGKKISRQWLFCFCYSHRYLMDCAPTRLLPVTSCIVVSAAIYIMVLRIWNTTYLTPLPSNSSFIGGQGWQPIQWDTVCT